MTPLRAAAAARKRSPAMTHDERVRVACERFAEGPPIHLPGETVDEGIEAALDAALKDVGGLDGLGELGRALDRAREMVEGLAASVRYWHEVYGVACDERDSLRADRDRLREALRNLADDPTEFIAADAVRAFARAALDESEAGT